MSNMECDSALTPEQIAGNLSAIVQNAEFYWELIGDDPRYKLVPDDQRWKLAEAGYKIARASIDRLTKTKKENVAPWASLNVWVFVERFAGLLRRHAIEKRWHPNENLPPATVWGCVVMEIKQWEPEPDFDLMRREIQENLEILAGDRQGVLPPAALDVLLGSTTGVSGEGETDKPSGMPWEEAAQRLNRLREKGEPWTSQQKMADQIGCAPSTINKAIARTTELQSWARQPEATPKAQSLTPPWRKGGGHTDMVTDRTPQSREPDPAAELRVREFLERDDLSDRDRATFNSFASIEDQIRYLDQLEELEAQQASDKKCRKMLGREP